MLNLFLLDTFSPTVFPAKTCLLNLYVSSTDFGPVQRFDYGNRAGALETLDTALKVHSLPPTGNILSWKQQSILHSLAYLQKKFADYKDSLLKH